MSGRISTGRLPAAASVLGALALACLSTAPVASASTLYACVKSKSGATRIVTRKAKCRHGERKLSWNTAGPTGPAGASGSTGATGAPGANGAVAAYTATNNGSVAIVPLKEIVALTKTVPPGSYSVSAKTVPVAEAAAEGHAELTCGLTDNPGTAYVPETLAIDFAAWISPLVKRASVGYSTATTLSLLSPVTSTVTSTLAIVCGSSEEVAGVTIGLVYSQLSAIQVSHIG
ncbi:MAG TPA: collagen-like protein [Solirubrobacteraceae bacterium]|nr:collagen-like protein [Solirubrobacteraceae bacterium]